jgi:transposase
LTLIQSSSCEPYVKRSKSDALDAEGICEAVTRPTMRFVAIKNPEQQAALMLHRTRDLLVRQRTMLVNALRGHLAEYGIIAPQGLPSVPKLMELAEKARGTALPELAWRCIRLILAQIEDVHGRIGQVEHEILAWHRTNELSQRLETIPGIGLITASALAAPSRIRAPSAQAGTWRPGSDLCHARVALAARCVWGTSPSRETDTCDGFWCWAPPR